MPSFEIRYEDFGRDASRRSGVHLFSVRSGDTEAMLAVEFPDDLGRQWRLESRANADEIQRRAALACLKGHLSGIGALVGQHGRWLLLTAWATPEAHEDRTVYQLPHELPYERKECRFQERGAAGAVCTAAGPADRVQRRTTQALCERCGLPSTDIICDNLVNVETAGFGTDQTPLCKRSLIGAQCDIGSEQFVEPARDAKLCVPGGRDCWVQTYQPEEAAPAVVAGAAQFSIGEAVDQVNAAFRKRYDRKLIVIEQARSMEDLTGECPTDEALQHKLQVLAGLLETMQLSGLLTQQKEEGRQGTIDLLERLVGRDFPTLPDHYVRNLRNINKLAAGYPRHAKVKNIERAHAELGLLYPVADYAKAWAVVRETFIQTLRQVALHLP